MRSILNPADQLDSFDVESANGEDRDHSSLKMEDIMLALWFFASVKNHVQGQASLLSDIINLFP